MTPAAWLRGALLGALLAVCALGGWDLDTAQPVFDEANALFRQAAETEDPRESFALYRSAALRYERLIGEGRLRAPKVYYNLGNAYFRTGDWGRAILNYRRALALDPSDANARGNLDAARARLSERTEPAAGEQTARALLFWHYDLSFAARAELFAAAWIVAWTLAAFRHFQPGRLPAAAVWAPAAAALALGLSLAAESRSREANDDAVIVAAETVARKGDGASYDAAFDAPLRSGTEFRILERRAWRHGRLSDGRTFWVPESAAESVGEGLD